MDDSFENLQRQLSCVEGVVAHVEQRLALTLVYDAWNRLVEVKQGSDTMAEYEYDGLGRRTVRGYDTSSLGSPDGTLDNYEHFFYSGQQVVETRDANSAGAQAESLQPHYQYVWSARYIDAAVLRDENTDQDGTCDDDRLYYLTDANHNVTALVDTAGDVQERYVYDPYGEVTIYDDDWSDTRSSSAEGNSLLHTGREQDDATGLYYHRARWYHTGTGQFTSRDPLGFAAGDANLYRYVGNSPLSRTDPSGLWDVEPGQSGGGGPTWGTGSQSHNWRALVEKDPGPLNHIVTVVSDWTNDGDAAAWAQAANKGVGWTDAVYDKIGSDADLLSALEHRFKQTGEKIDILDISGHGLDSGGGVVYKVGSFSYSNLDANEVKRLKAVLSDDAVIYIWGCDQALGDRDVDCQALADLLGLEVMASPYGIGAGPDVHSDGRLGPEWETFTPGGGGVSGGAH